MNNEYFDTNLTNEQSSVVQSDNQNNLNTQGSNHMSVKEETDFVTHINHLYEVENNLKSSENDPTNIISQNYNLKNIQHDSIQNNTQLQTNKELKDSTLRDNSKSYDYT